jgi:hypothetical protein
MSLLIVYVLTLVVGQSLSVGVGLLVDRYQAPSVSLPVFIACYFAMFWLAWRFALRVTPPRTPPQR